MAKEVIQNIRLSSILYGAQNIPLHLYGGDCFSISP